MTERELKGEMKNRMFSASLNESLRTSHGHVTRREMKRIHTHKLSKVGDRKPTSRPKLVRLTLALLLRTTIATSRSRNSDYPPLEVLGFPMIAHVIYLKTLGAEC